MSLKELNIPSVLDTSKNNLITDLFGPALKNATYYDRGVGYFSAGWLRINSKGMKAFAENKGQARWITSPIMSEADWSALVEGTKGRVNQILQEALQKNISDLEKDLEKNTLSALAWLVADGILDFKLAVPRDKLSDGEFHAKFGIFTDTEGNQLSFNGSYNDSIQGIKNYETLHVFKGWEEVTKHFVLSDKNRFDKLWTNLDPNVKVHNIPDAMRAQILKLRTQERPYEYNKNTGFVFKPKQFVPQVPETIKLRDYQNEAIDAWFNNNCQGLLEMATGTGKTITSLAASVKLFERESKLALVVAVPYKHLVDQWSKEAKQFGYQPILAYISKKRWLNELNQQILDYNAGHRNCISVITTHDTFTDEDFQKSILRVNAPSLILADEAHHLGAERRRAAYPHHIPFRLALSATPDRWFDDLGTRALHDFFGTTVFEFTLEQAIGVSLTPYYYHPHLVNLTEEEMLEYDELTAKIARLMGREDEKGQDILKQLLMKRANLLNKAENKLKCLSELIDQQENISHALFYCAPGQIDDVVRLAGYEKGLMLRRFTAEEDAKERRELLNDFAKGNLNALVAMKCLDEGVDVPSTRMAFFLASSGNPREFVQRRGRVLRKYPDKEHSIIHDLITVPPSTWQANTSPINFNVERGIIKRELERFKEFANLARNEFEALDVIWDLAKRYNLMDF